jgi:hypothetical protein
MQATPPSLHGQKLETTVQQQVANQQRLYEPPSVGRLCMEQCLPPSPHKHTCASKPAYLQNLCLQVRIIERCQLTQRCTCTNVHREHECHVVDLILLRDN